MKFGQNSTTEKSARFSKPPFPWHYFQLKDQKVFGFAGLYDVWKDRETGKEIHSYTGSVSVKLVSFTLLDIIRDKKPASAYSKEAYRNIALKSYCDPQAISITRSSKWAVVFRMTLCMIWQCLTPASTYPTTIRIREIIVFSALSAGLSACPRGLFFG